MYDQSERSLPLRRISGIMATKIFEWFRNPVEIYSGIVLNACKDSLPLQNLGIFSGPRPDPPSQPTSSTKMNRTRISFVYVFHHQRLRSDPIEAEVH